MTTQRRTGLQSVPIVALIMAIGWIVGGWAFARFVHYHSQNRLLRPADYEAEVVSAADYVRLSDPTATSVRLSDGREVTRAEIWHSVVLPNYKPLDGGHRYVLVTIKGTAPFLPTLEATLIPALIVLVIGLAFAVMPLVRRGSGQKEQPA
jgi:hypothetical protein